MNRRDLLKTLVPLTVSVGAVSLMGPTKPSSKPFLRMKAGDLGSERVKVFLDGVEVTRDCCMVDTQRGEVELFERPLRVVNGRVHRYVRTGAVRVELDGKVYTSE